jgi:adenylate cyclase
MSGDGRTATALHDTAVAFQQRSQVPDGQTITLRPLSNGQSTELVHGLLGSDASVGGLAEVIAERAGGNPFFVEEIVRDLAERGVLRGRAGDYHACGDVTDVEVPATLQATIGARIDRLTASAKGTRMLRRW